MAKVIIKKCIYCGKEFNSNRLYQTTCSKSCKESLERMNSTYPDGSKLPYGFSRCIKCGIVFCNILSDLSGPQFCSFECRDSYTIHCRYCGKEFKGRPASEFCSDLCKHSYTFDNKWEKTHRPKRICACPACDEPVVGANKFCSEFCRRSTAELEAIMNGNSKKK